MNDIQKMLRAIINGQSAFRQEVLSRINNLDLKIDKLGERLEGKIDSIEAKLTKRLDIIGKQLAYLEDDAPTREAFNNL